MKADTLYMRLGEVLEESKKIKKLASKLQKSKQIGKKDELLGSLNASLSILKTHCESLDNELNEISTWKEIEETD